MNTVIVNAKPNEFDVFSYVETHFKQVAFAVSTFVLFILQPFSSFMGFGLGIFLQHIFEPKPFIQGMDDIITNGHTAITIIGALAAFVRLTPSGQLGGYLFQALPSICATAIGSCAYTSLSFYISPFP